MAGRVTPTSLSQKSNWKTLSLFGLGFFSPLSEWEGEVFNNFISAQNRGDKQGRNSDRGIITVSERTGE